MFKSARWRSEKNKIKAVFKLEFHATQLTQLVGDALMLFVIPADVGKPTGRLEKVKVKDESCYWQKPHFETVKFSQDMKTGKFHEKIYQFVVSAGSLKFGGVGDVSIDFASYAEATKLSSLSLPLKTANSDAVLHVSIQRVQDSLDQREIDGSENANYQDRSLRAQFSNGDIDQSIRSNPTEDHGTLNDNINRDSRASSGSDITLSSSDSSSGLETPREAEPKNTKSTHESSTTTIYEEQHHRSSEWDWLDDSSISPRNSLLNEIVEEGSPDDVIKKLEIEVSILTRKVDVSELELQTLRKQIAKESKKSHEFSKEVASLKEECEKLKADQVKEVKVKVNDNFLIEGGDPWELVNELRQELNYEKDLNSNLRLQLQKTQESNAELILAVQDLDEMLEQKDLEMSKSKCGEKSQKVKPKSDTDDDDDEQKALEEIVREHSGVNEAYLLEQKIMDLEGEMELYRRDKDELEIQMEQIALDYEILKQENHEMSCKIEQNRLQDQLNIQYELENQIESLENELKMKSEELSESISAINDLENVIKNLEEDLENQTHGFEVDLEELTRAKIEQEQRAIRAEESLRKMKLQNSNTAERLQEEFRRLSTQMSLTFEANEKVAMNAMDEANKLRVEKRNLEQMLEQFKGDLEYLRDCYQEKMVDFSSQITLKSKQLEKMEIEIKNISSSCGAEIEKLKQEKQDLESQRKDLENEVYLTKIELTESMGVQKDHDSEIKLLQSEIERLKSRCNDMKMFLKENDYEKEKLEKRISQLKVNLKSKEDAFSSIEKKLKDINNRTTNSRNNRSYKEVMNLSERIKQLEGQIKLKETALEKSEISFLEKEKDFKCKIEEYEKRLEVLDQSTEIPQVSTAEYSRPAIIRDQENLDGLSNEMALLKNRNKAMEFELNEMQERYSEISLKFAEVEGERQQLVMTLRNLKNAKKC